MERVGDIAMLCLGFSLTERGRESFRLFREGRLSKLRAVLCIILNLKYFKLRKVFPYKSFSECRLLAGAVLVLVVTINFSYCSKRFGCRVFLLRLFLTCEIIHYFPAIRLNIIFRRGTFTGLHTSCSFKWVVFIADESTYFDLSY